MTISDKYEVRFLDPKNDIVFKKIFGTDGHEQSLIEFLNSVLKLREPIVSVKIGNPFQQPIIEDLKGMVLDIRARDSQHEFLIEMQVESRKNFAKRVFCYTSRAYATQIESGEDYEKLKPVIFLGVMNFDFFEGDDRPIKRHVLLDDERYYQKFKEVDMNFIELPKFHKTESELETATDKWLFFLKNAPSLHTVPDWANSEGLRWAYQVAERHNWTKKELEVYDYWSRKDQEQKTAIEGAWEEGEAVGEKRGIQKGMKQGIEQGIEQGKAAGRMEIAASMLRQGIDISLISELTKLSIEEIEKLEQPETVA